MCFILFLLLGIHVGVLWVICPDSVQPVPMVYTMIWVVQFKQPFKNTHILWVQIQMYYSVIILEQTSKFKFMGMLFFSVIFSQDAKNLFPLK